MSGTDWLIGDRSYFTCERCEASWSLEGDHPEALCPNCDVLVIRRPRRELSLAERALCVCGHPRRGHSVQEWDAEPEGNKLILLFEGYIYGDTAVSEGMVVAAIHHFRTKQPIWLNPDWTGSSAVDE